MLVTAPVMVFLGFRWPEDRVTGPEDCVLSAWPFMCPLRLPLRVPLDAAFLGFFARPLAWAAMFAGAVTADCGPSAAARVWDCLVVTCGFTQYGCVDVSKHQKKQRRDLRRTNTGSERKKRRRKRGTHWLVKDDDGGEG